MFGCSRLQGFQRSYLSASVPSSFGLHLEFLRHSLLQGNPKLHLYSLSDSQVLSFPFPILFCFVFIYFFCKLCLFLSSFILRKQIHITTYNISHTCKSYQVFLFLKTNSHMFLLLFTNLFLKIFINHFCLFFSPNTFLNIHHVSLGLQSLLIQKDRILNEF